MFIALLRGKRAAYIDTFIQTLLSSFRFGSGSVLNPHSLPQSLHFREIMPLWLLGRSLFGLGISVYHGRTAGIQTETALTITLVSTNHSQVLLKDLFLRCLVFCYTFQLLTFSLTLVHTHVVPEGHCYKCNVYSAQWPCRNNTHSPPPHFWYLQPPL